jgi:formylglycine-generating enzyme required for sulfatase activity
VDYKSASVNVLTKNERYRYGLPTAADWAYAEKADATGRYAGYLDAMAWCGKNSDYGSYPLGKKRANSGYLACW